MDNPWANAWDDNNNSDKPKPSPSSSTTHITEHHDTEVDIALPSWSTGASINWAEPSQDQVSLWSTAQAANDWQPDDSPYKNILSPRQSDLSEAQREPEPEPELTPPSSSPPTPPPADNFLPEVEPVPLPEPVENLSESVYSLPPDSPDAFGTFETGFQTENLAVDQGAWSPPQTAYVLPSARSNAWDDQRDHVASPTEEEPVDEWEAATLQKQKQDLHVPPELLASILRQCEELSEELWPDTGDSTGEPLERIEDDDRLAHSVSRLVPADLVLPQMPVFNKTFISKSVSESIKLTRHVPFTHKSPMSHYLASKGSTAWEASVKSRIDVSNDDLLPPGWRMVSKQAEGAVNATTENKRKPTGGLLSFFSRRPATPPPAEPAQRSQSPANQSPITASHTPRASLDLSRSTQSPPVLAPAQVMAPVRASSPAPAVIPDLLLEPAQTTSAVSRFLGRFSRKPSGRNSLALSSDDLEFLSDIVPSASDIADDHLDAFAPAKTQTVDPHADDDFLSFFEAPPNSQRGTKPPIASTASSSRSNTPSTFTSPPSRSNSIAPPPLKRSFTPIMSATSSPTSALHSRPDPFAFPPPLHSETPLFPAPPPAPSAAPTQSSLSAFSDFEDDDFSDFHSQPALSASQVSQASFGGSSSFSSNRSFRLSPTSNPPDSFDEMVFSPLRTPSPPRPPTKSPPLPVSKSPVPQLKSLAFTSFQSAPPQPQGPPLTDLDCFGTGGNDSGRRASDLGSVRNSNPPGIQPIIPLAAPISSASVKPKPQTTLLPAFSQLTPAPSRTPSQAVGLTAQDLSFFESL